MATTTTMMI